MTVEQAAGMPGGGGVRRVLAAPLQPRTWTATIYLLLAMLVGLAWQVVLAVGLTLGVGLVVIWVGVFVLALTVLAWRGGAWLERRWLRLMLGIEIAEPYRPLPAGSLWRRARVLDPAPRRGRPVLGRRPQLPRPRQPAGGADGADPARGSGLRGLADRVAAVGGHLTVTSPQGGPTVIRAELPCGP